MYCSHLETQNLFTQHHSQNEGTIIPRWNSFTINTIYQISLE